MFVNNSTYGGGDPYSSSVRDFLGLPSMPTQQSSNEPGSSISQALEKQLDPSNYADWAELYGLTDYMDNDGKYSSVNYYKQNEFEAAIINLYKQGKISANDLAGYLNYLVYREGDSTFEKWLDNQIALENTNSAREWEEKMASTDLLRSASQLSQLGLSPSTAISVGGSKVNPVDAANNVKSNVAQQMYESRMGMTKSLISMVTGMASAGIGGAALGLAKNSLARQAMATAHNANKALDNYKDFATTKMANNAGDIAHIYQLLGK
jgi:hypothetical protein